MMDIFETALQGQLEFWKKFDVTMACQMSDTLKEMKKFLDFSPKVFERSHLMGHFTGSAMVVTEDFSRALLTHHVKLDKWLQLGGHADGDSDLARVALKEAEEESGLSDLELKKWQFDTAPFDFDIHEIPARKNELRHLHFDVRYLVVAKGDLAPRVSAESKDLKWIPLNEISFFTQEDSMIRQFRKLEILHNLFN